MQIQGCKNLLANERKRWVLTSFRLMGHSHHNEETSSLHAAVEPMCLNQNGLA